MCDMKCYICLEDTTDTIKTECSHYFHAACLLKLTYPKCPTCRCDLTTFLTKYKSKKNIKNGIKCENLRLLLNAIPNYNELDEYSLLKICMDMKRFNKDCYYDKLYDIIKVYLSSNTQPFQNLFCCNNKTTKKGIYLYYIEIETLFKNIIFGYNHKILKWFELSKFNNHKEFYVFSKGLYNKTCDEQNKYGVLVVLKDGEKLHIKSLVIENKNEITKLPSQKSMITSLCENENLVLNETKNNPEEEYVQYVQNDKIQEIFKFNTIYDFLTSYVDTYMQNMTHEVNLEFCIFEDDNIKNIFTYSVIYKNEKVKFFIENTDKYVSIKKISFFIESKINKNNTFFIKIITKKNKDFFFMPDKIHYTTTFFGNINGSEQYVLKHVMKHEMEELSDDYLTNINFDCVHI